MNHEHAADSVNTPTELIQDVQRFIPDLQSWSLECTEVELESLSFYADYQLLRLTETGKAGQILWGLYAPGDFWPLDGSTESIYHVNKVSPLRLSGETVAPYVTFLLNVLLGHPEKIPDFSSQPMANAAGFHVRLADTSFDIGMDGAIKQGEIPSEIARRAREQTPKIRRVKAINGVRRWKVITPEEEKQLLSDLKTLSLQHDRLRIRRADISFYKKHAIYELLAESDGGFNQSYLLYRPNYPVSLDRTSSSLRDANREEPFFSASSPSDSDAQADGDSGARAKERARNMVDYLRFFCWAISAENGRFLIVERIRDIPWDEAPPEDKRAKILKSLKAIEVLNQPGEAGVGDKWILSGIVSYGDALFKAWFSVGSDGAVQMGDDEEITAGLPVLYGTNSEPHISIPGKVEILKKAEGPRPLPKPKTYLDEQCSKEPLELCGADRILDELLQGKQA